MPDRDTSMAQRYADALAPDGGLLWQTFCDKKRDKALTAEFRGPLGQVSRRLERLNDQGAGIYCAVNAIDGHRGNDNATGIRAICIDCDGTMPLPTEWSLAPSIVTLRSHTYWHAYWLVTGEDASRLDQFGPLQATLAAHYHTDPSLVDLARVMRVPGFLHCKAEPHVLRLVRAEPGLRYSLDEIGGAHPVRWRDVEDDYVRRAKNVGIPEAADEARRRWPPPPDREYGSALSGEHDWQVDNFRKWCLMIETAAGDANPNGGRNRAAWKIACQGAGRSLDQAIVFGEVAGYLTRAEWDGDIEREAEAMVRRAFARSRTGSAPQPRGDGVIRREERPPARPSGLPPQPRSSADCGRGDDGDDPPIVIADDDDSDDDDDEGAGPYGGLDLEKLSTRWLIAGDGSIMPVEWVQSAEAFKPKPNRRITSLPIWPEQQGTDVASSATWWRIAWHSPDGRRREQWVHERDLKDGYALVELPDAPVTRRKAQDCAVWLTEARVAVIQPRTQVISRVGWSGVNGSRRWVWPGVGTEHGIQYIGDDLENHGDVDEWARGLRALVDLPEDDGYTALACVCLSAAAPWSRIAGGRNPVIGLMCRSSSGKGSALDFALSLWSNADMLRLPASSTAKGIQDRATQVPDCPVFLDELQQLAEYSMQQASDALYFLANGQRRTTSSKSQTAVGGERRFGVGFYAAEAPVLPGLNLGVHYRVLELDGMPCPDEATAKALQHATTHCGVMASLISEIVQQRQPTEWADHMRDLVAIYRPGGSTASMHETIFSGMRGDDAGSLALVHHGAVVLSQATGIPIDHERLVVWLAQQVARQRRSTQDRESVCLESVLATVLNQQWIDERETPGGDIVEERKRSVKLQQRPLAWRSYGVDGATVGLDIDPDHPALAGIFREYGGTSRMLKQWGDRGWIAKQGKGWRVRRRNGAHSGYVVRFTQSGLDAVEEGAAV